MDHASQLSTEALHTTTLHIYIDRREMDPPVNQAQRPCILLHCIYIYIEREREGRWTPQSIEHRGLAYCYTAYINIYREKGDGPPSQSSTEALHTTTLHI